jgi:hypothetical protein
MEMLRISLFGPPNRRKQPKRYTPLFLKFLEQNGSGGIHAAAKQITFWSKLCFCYGLRIKFAGKLSMYCVVMIYWYGK